MKLDEGTFLGEIEELLNTALGRPTGTLALQEVCEKHRDSRVYVPRTTKEFREWRNAQIRAGHKGGDSYEALADAWGLMRRRIREIIHGD